MTVMIQAKAKSKKPARHLVEKPNIQRLSLRAITVDPELQSRVETDIEHCRFLSGELEICGELKPILVYFDGKKYWLANGFHRFTVYKKAGRDAINAIIVQGTRRDAMIESCKVNDDASKGKTKEDKEKSVKMLLSDPEWFGRSDKTIGVHCGIGGITVRRYRLEYCQNARLELPETTSRSDGRVVPYTNSRKTKDKTPYKRTNGRHQVSINGKNVHLGMSESQALDRLNEIKRASARYAQYTDRIARHLVRRGILALSAKFHNQSSVSAYYTNQFVFDLAVADDIQSIRNACLNVLAIKHARCPSGTPIVVCDHAAISGNHTEFIDTLKSMGIEFLTIEEFYERLGVAGDDDNAGSLVLA